jgi:hypothetical protein
MQEDLIASHVLFCREWSQLFESIIYKVSERLDNSIQQYRDLKRSLAGS